ncbi:hypothetical protein EMIHUDRAFT_95324 [Emiliania huxleyi CCMP1516]|uniref:J domain-containing protein n=2 Tax=Emiliania huxleyi TaxID=2903 RepID=A0A0D3L2E5_EMIH1|nr:hypothetical protein EMIHUDRAFT_95324 [Emiliania huxleyi CCMP1516]EOD42180.1 hypothetical protein EMIHUDRAFT_95324 [Emiliania huxleyi CCMP1516]|eukprot:XP_005794609.1 hypothetical protein EMIHUDRAFT_95324 [Emiliania huxleyi CCMP1516]
MPGQPTQPRRAGSPSPTRAGVPRTSMSERILAAEQRLEALDREREVAAADLTALRERAAAPATERRLRTAYALWLCCPFYPAYALYLGRDLHACLYTLTLGGFGVGWLVDGACLPWYVADYNEPLGYLMRAQRRAAARLFAWRTLLLPARWLLVSASCSLAAALAAAALPVKRLEAAVGAERAAVARLVAGLLGATVGATCACRCVAAVRTRARPQRALFWGALLLSLVLASEEARDKVAEEGVAPSLAAVSLSVAVAAMGGAAFDPSLSPSRGGPAGLAARLLLQLGGVGGVAAVAALSFHLNGDEWLGKDGRKKLREAGAQLHTLPTCASCCATQAMAPRRRSASRRFLDVSRTRVPGDDAATLLGVARDASPAEIKQAHRRLARLHHPDKQQDASREEKEEAERMMSRLNAAKDTLLGES